MGDFPTIVVNLVQQLNTLLRESGGKAFISRIALDETALRRNFEMNGDAIMAEPIYISLQMAGHEGDAHELVNHVALPRSKEKKISLLGATIWALKQEAKKDPSVGKVWERIPKKVINVLNHPSLYLGDAAGQAHKIVNMAEKYLREG